MGLVVWKETANSTFPCPSSSCSSGPSSLCSVLHSWPAPFPCLRYSLTQPALCVRRQSGSGRTEARRRSFGEKEPWRQLRIGADSGLRSLPEVTFRNVPGSCKCNDRGVSARDARPLRPVFFLFLPDQGSESAGKVLNCFEESMRSRWLMAVLCAPLMTGCEGPTVPEDTDVRGTYVLQSVNGKPLPALEGDLTVTSARVILTETQWSSRTVWRRSDGQSFDASLQGNYTQLGADTVVLQPVGMKATIERGTMRMVTSSGSVWTYQKR